MDLSFVITASGASGSFTDGTSTMYSVAFSTFLTRGSLKTINDQSLVGSGNIELVTGSGITNISVVTALPGSPNENTLYIITEA